MDPKLIKFRPAAFALAGLCFLLPFVTVSCGGMSETFSGIQLAFGGTIQGQRMSGNLPTVLALAAAVVGLVISLRFAGATQGVTAAGIAGATLLLVAQVQLRGEAQGQGPVQLTFEPGYWLAVLGLGAGAALSHLPAAARSPAPDDARPTESGPRP